LQRVDVVNKHVWNIYTNIEECVNFL